MISSLALPDRPQNLTEEVLIKKLQPDLFVFWVIGSSLANFVASKKINLIQKNVSMNLRNANYFGVLLWLYLCVESIKGDERTNNNKPVQTSPVLFLPFFAVATFLETLYIRITEPFYIRKVRVHNFNEECDSISRFALLDSQFFFASFRWSERDNFFKVQWINIFFVYWEVWIDSRVLSLRFFCVFKRL